MTVPYPVDNFWPIVIIIDLLVIIALLLACWSWDRR
jgi:hypothetical protein